MWGMDLPSAQFACEPPGKKNASLSPAYMIKTYHYAETLVDILRSRSVTLFC